MPFEGKEEKPITALWECKKAIIKIPHSGRLLYGNWAIWGILLEDVIRQMCNIKLHKFTHTQEREAVLLRSWFWTSAVSLCVHQKRFWHHRLNCAIVMMRHCCSHEKVPTGFDKIYVNKQKLSCNLQLWHHRNPIWIEFQFHVLFSEKCQ